MSVFHLQTFCFQRKENTKETSFCFQNNDTINFQGIEKALCGKIYPEVFTIKRLLVIQMEPIPEDEEYYCLAHVGGK